jgi:phospholipase/carboxylesterase
MKRVIFLHGVGSSGAGMQPLASALGLSTEQGYFPDGLQPFDSGPGRQWFSVQGITEANRPERIAAALPAFSKRLSEFGPLKDCILVGFSQGAIMALHAAASGLPIAGVIAIAGRLASPVPARSDWPAITLLNGDADPVVPVSFARATQTWLNEAGAEPSLTEVKGLGHSIDVRMVDLIRTALGLDT